MKSVYIVYSFNGVDEINLFGAYAKGRNYELRGNTFFEGKLIVGDLRKADIRDELPSLFVRVDSTLERVVEEFIGWESLESVHR
jgi:hypothetical protein